MTDEFDRYLARALAPAERDPDRRFVARVQATIALDERFRTERRATLSALAIEVGALLMVAAGLVWLGQAPAVAGFADESPWLALAALLAGFSLLVVLLSSRPSKARAR